MKVFQENFLGLQRSLNNKKKLVRHNFKINTTTLIFLTSVKDSYFQCYNRVSKRIGKRQDRYKL